MCKQSRLAPNCCHLAQCFYWFSDGAVEVHWLGYCTEVFASCDNFRASGRKCKKTSSFETEDIIQEELFFNLRRVLAIENRVGTPPDTT